MKALRPPSLVIALVSCGLGAALAWRDGRGDLVATVLVVAAGMVLQAGVNLVNDFFEFKTRRVDDKIAHLGMFGPERQLVEWFIFLSGLACFAAVVPAGLYLAWRSGWPFAVLGAAGLVGGYAYTGEPLNYKRRGLGVPLVFFLMGVLLVAGSYFAVARTLERPGRAPVAADIDARVADPPRQRAARPRAGPSARHPHPHGAHRLPSGRGTVPRPARLRVPRHRGARACRPRPAPGSCAAHCPFAVPPTVLVFRPHERRQGIIPLVMLHHLVFGGLFTAAFLVPITGGST